MHFFSVSLFLADIAGPEPSIRVCAGEGGQASAAWVEEQLAEARTRLDLPALARRDSVLMADSRLSNIFTCQPQQKNSEILRLCMTLTYSWYSALLAY